MFRVVDFSIVGLSVHVRKNNHHHHKLNALSYYVNDFIHTLVAVDLLTTELVKENTATLPVTIAKR